ncbi:DUF2534 family protein [Kosakonia oryziphila]|jgi:hypothetical protein|uniref:DUF2534 domain-containing protein n=1 Tax=Kosakonia oryziphila TaxID=1005667 RepID=A0A1C4E204_9ENTR|nr:DUF2534 family protein [Kosakonia oryziphila]SCC37541.1 Protein of unknown function [Kosakonia oryziphila]
MLEKLRTREGKKFITAVVIVFLIAVSVISKAAFEGVEEQYNLPMETWTASMFIIQGAWVAIYSLMFTIIGSLPFGFYFLGPKDDKG